MIPTDLSGCTVWLDASQLTGADGSSIGTQWNDLSGNGNHGAVVGSPAPVVKTNALAGKRVVRFAINEGRVRGGGMFPAATPNSSFTAIFVGRQWGTYIGRIFSNVLDPYNFLVGTHVSGRNSCYDAGWINAGVAWDTPPTPWTIWGFVYTGSPNLGTFFVDGVDSGSGSGGGAHDHRWALSGWHATGEQETCDVEVAELITYNRALTPTERILVEDYLDQKWINPPTSFPVSASFHSTGQFQATVTIPPPPDGGQFPWEINPGAPPPHRPAPSWSGGGVALLPHKKLGGWFANLQRVGHLTGMGTLSAVVAPKLKVGAAFSAEGVLSPNLRPRGFRTIAFGGSGMLYSDPQPFRTASLIAPFTSDGALGAYWDDGLSAVVGRQYVAYFGGGGGLSVDFVGGIVYPDGLSALIWERHLTAAGFSSTGQLLAVLDRLQAGVADFTGIGALSATVNPIITVLAQLTGSGALTAQMAGGVTVLAQMLGSGQLSADLFARKLADAGFQGAGAMTALLKASYQSTPTAGGVGTISALIYARYLMAAGLSGGGTLSSLLSQLYPLAAALTGSGSLAAAAFQKFLIDAGLSGAGTLSTSMFQSYAAAAAHSGSGALTAGAFQKYLCSAGVSGDGTLTSTVSIGFMQFTETNTARTNQTRPAGATGAWVTLIGAGGSGGSGSVGNTLTNRTAASGGGGGGFVPRVFVPVANMGATYSVTVPPATTGGAAKGTGSNASGNPGAAGGAAVFTSGSTTISAGGGGAGVAGVFGSSTPTQGGAGGTVSGATGATGGAGGDGDADFTGTAGGNTASSGGAGGGGGGGGGKAATNSSMSGGKGGDANGVSGGAAGTTSSAPGSSAGSLVAGVAGPGGGGGGSQLSTAPGGSGGSANGYGGGGGGGAVAGTAGQGISGGGGSGGPGYTKIEWV